MKEVLQQNMVNKIRRKLLYLLYPQIDKLISQAQPVILHHYSAIAGEAKVVKNVNVEINDDSLVERIITAYSASEATDLGEEDSIWLQEFAELNRDVQAMLRSGSKEPLTALLRNPADSMLFFGFDSIQSRDAPKNNDPFWVNWQHQLCYDNLLQLAAAAGLRRVTNPEAGVNLAGPPVEDLLQELDLEMGFKIDFPNIFAEEIGLNTSRGVANYRAIQSLYQAWRIKQVTPNLSQASVCEIGGGLGRTAYYCNKLGVTDYTIIDLPLTNVSQAYYLGRTLGQDQIALYNESVRDVFKILPPIEFLKGQKSYDLVVNFDSMTEMSKTAAMDYLNVIFEKSLRFLSINHEANRFTVAELLKSYPALNILRIPSWLRKGYVEEYVEIE